jgi:hypothetical protein
LLEYCEQTLCTYRPSNGPRVPSGVWVEESGLGLTLHRQGRAADIDMRFIPKGLLAPLIADRAIAVKGYVSGGRLIKLAQQAHERTQNFRGTSSNHLLRQLLGFELDARTEPQELVNAFCAGVAIAFMDRGGKHVPSADTPLLKPALPEPDAPDPVSAEEQARRDADADVCRRMDEVRAEFRRRAVAEVEAGRPYPRTPSAVGLSMPVRTGTVKF